jgi:hypothetical protein
LNACFACKCDIFVVAHVEVTGVGIVDDV